MTYAQLQTLIDDNLESGTVIPAVKHREVEHALLDYIQANLFQTGDIKLVSCDLTYLNANFETNGLGKNLRLGWAICNGSNGTPNIQGRTVIGFGTESGKSYALGQTGGSKDAVVVEHNHSINLQQLNSNSDTGSGRLATGGQSAEGTIPNINTETTGVPATDKNMPPYITQLYIMKL
jgi:hypothetical protein